MDNNEIREKAEEMRDNLRQEIRESKQGLLKLAGLEMLPFVWGASLGTIGRTTGVDWIPAIPLGMDLMHNCSEYFSLRGMWGLTKYGAGVALPYADVIYHVFQGG